ncbi:putative feruloyl esterase B-2 [Metarhizium anisopliae]
MVCLTAPQIETAKKLYQPYLDPNKTMLFPGLPIGSDAAALATQPSGLGIDLLRYWVFNDSNWDFTQFKFEDIARADQVNPGNAMADNFNLLPFKQRGGKLMHYHGLADPIIPPGSSQHFYNLVYRTLAPSGVDLDDFYRYFTIPGMSHCMGSQVAPWYIGGGTQFVPGITHSIPGFMDRQHDVILAIMAWVEKGEAPEHLIATKFRNDTGSQNIVSQRPICPYPQRVRYNEQGNPEKPDNWKCMP